jgi:hypothetical protein
VTSPIDVELPTDLDQQIEAALETLRGYLLNPDPDPKQKPIGIALSIFAQLLTKVNPAGAALAEAGILIQACALNSVIYQLSDVTPGEWFQECTTDLKRALVAIGLLSIYVKKLDASEADAPSPKAVDPNAQPNAAPAQ